jgi:hypothetical protein
VTLLDVNILIYAYNVDMPQHAATLAWLEGALVGPDRIGVPLAVVWAFLRLTTNSRSWPNPMPVADAFRAVKELLALPGVVMVEPAERHLEILEFVMSRNNVTGTMVSDAVLAALAIEHGATLASTDRDFSRFENLRWVNPLA